jgi:hypothetical protein
VFSNHPTVLSSADAHSTSSLPSPSTSPTTTSRAPSAVVVMLWLVQALPSPRVF